MFTFINKIVNGAKKVGAFVVKGIKYVAGIVKTHFPAAKAAVKAGASVVVKAATKASAVVKSVGPLKIMKALLVALEGIAAIAMIAIPFKALLNKFKLNRKIKKAKKAAEKKMKNRKGRVKVDLDIIDDDDMTTLDEAMAKKSNLKKDDPILKPFFKEKSKHEKRMDKLRETLPEGTQFTEDGDVVETTNFNYTICGRDRKPVKIADGVIIDHVYRRIREVATGKKISNIPDINADGKYDHMGQEAYEDFQIDKYIEMGLLPKGFDKTNILSKKGSAFH